MRAYKANMIPGGVTPTINVSQYDNDYAVTVTLIEGAEIYTPPVGATIRVEGTKPDGHGFEYPCTYQGNVVTMPIYTQMTAVAGRFPIELVVYQSGLRVGSCNIIFAVERAPLGEGTDISETVIPDIIAGAQAQADAAAASAALAAEAAAQVLASQIVTEASGSIASFSDGADDIPMQSVVAEITPIQDLNGQANPYPAGGGVNKLRLSDTTLTGTVSGLTYTYDPATEKITLSGTNTNTTSHNLRFFGSESGFSVPAFSAGETYTLSVMLPTTMYCQFTYRDANNVQRALGYIVGTGSWANVTFTIPSNYVTFGAFQLYVSGTATTLNTTVYFELSEGSTAPTAWSPYENICPISGRTGMTVTAAGANVWDEEWETGIYSNDTGAPITNKSRIRAKNPIPVKVGVSYYLYCGNANIGIIVHYFNASGTHITTASVKNAVFTPPANTAYILFNSSGADISTYNHDISINCPSTDTAYHAYTAQTYPITWETEAGTVYGGTLDVVSGVLTVDRGYFTDDGTANWIRNNDGSFYLASGILNPYQTTVARCACNYAPYVASNSGISVFLRENGFISLAKDWGNTFADVASLKAAFASTPFQMVYPLATPQTYQLTPTEVRTILGGNTIYTDAGDVSVEYIADTKLYIDNKIAELQALVLEN